MKAPDFDYVRAETVDQVFEAMDSYGEGAQILAGGQSLMATLNLRLSQPECLIDINRLSELTGVEEAADGGVRVGALTRHVEMADARIGRAAPLAALALPHIAHPAIRNRGTVGGSVALADPAAEWPACMVVLGAGIELQGPEGRRTVAAEDFFQGLYETARRPGELLAAIQLPASDPARRFGFSEFARREGDFAIAGVAGSAIVEGDRFSDLRLVVFGCEPFPRLAAAARAAADAGAGPGEIAAALDDDLDPMEDLQGSADYKRHLAGVLARRVLTGMLEGAA